jgi:hypothetical protein
MQPDLEKLADRDEEHGVSRFFEVKTVYGPRRSQITPLKQGVNDNDFQQKTNLCQAPPISA